MIIETDIGEWYFFSYFNELMISRSSIDEFNINILDVKSQKKKLPASKGQVQYQYELSSETDVDNFKNVSLDSRLTLYFSLYAY